MMLVNNTFFMLTPTFLSNACIGNPHDKKAFLCFNCFTLWKKHLKSAVPDRVTYKVPFYSRFFVKLSNSSLLESFMTFKSTAGGAQ